MRQWRWAHCRSAAACRSCLLLPQHLPLGPPHHGSGSCQMIGPHAINSSPCANRQNHSLFLCRSRRARMERPAQGQIVREGKEEKGPTRSGVGSWGVRTSPATSIAQSRAVGEPPLPSSGSFHLRNVLTDFQQKCTAVGAWWTSQSAHLPDSS